MSHKKLASWLRWIVIGMAITGAGICFVFLPFRGQELINVVPGAKNFLLAWLIFIWLAVAPCYMALFYTWKIIKEIQEDNSYSVANAEYLAKISYLAIGDAVFVLVLNVAYFLLGMNSAGLFVLLLGVVFVGVTIAIVAALLSRLVLKAAQIKQENELTI